MLARAEARGAYDELMQAELTAFLERGANAFDLIVSADTLIYFGALEEIFAALANAARPDACFVSTFEQAVGGAAPTGYRLGPTGRYQHARDYVEQTLADAGIATRRIATEVLRSERGMVLRYGVTRRVRGPCGCARRRGGANMAKRVYGVPVPPDVEPSEALAEAQDKAKGVGITISGNTESGTFSGVASGTYEVHGNTLRFAVDKKPMIVSWGMIEKGLTKVFGNFTVVS